MSGAVVAQYYDAKSDKGIIRQGSESTHQVAYHMLLLRGSA